MSQTKAELIKGLNINASAPATALNVDSSGRVGIGITTPDTTLTVRSSGVSIAGVNSHFLLSDSTTAATGVGGSVLFEGNYTSGGAKAVYGGIAGVKENATDSNYAGGLKFYSRANGSLPALAMTIDSSQRLLVGTSTAAGGQIEAKTASIVSGDSAYAKKAFIANIPQGIVNTTGSLLAGFDSSIHGVDLGYTYNGAGYNLTFGTNSTTTGSPTERMRIDSSGKILVGKITSAFETAGVILNPTGTIDVTRNGGLLFLNRLTTDGSLIDFYQDSAAEGSISVSGTTVSYNGAHLSRWSQLPSGVERNEILRGSVLSNLDEMCEWGNEDNEQLNRMKVSDVEGDKNVSGVFQAWDDDDDTYTNDFYCAMTGDFIIRIAGDTTVERGDLLMSAGDGTAKPQGDGYVQDKTIAKVTSTTMSCTYDDGSYCVPCVLMAC